MKADLAAGPPFDAHMLLHQALPEGVSNERLLQNEHPTSWINPTYKGVYDLVVIGGGPGGLTAARHAADKGAKVAVIEEALLGGECFNVGCIPSKSLIRTSRLYADMRNAENFGGEVPEKLEIDFARVMERMQRIRAQISGRISAAELKQKGIDLYFGHAAFAGVRSISVDGAFLRFKKALIATGSKAIIPSTPGLREVGFFTNETIFNITALPQKLLVIGGGAIGCELAQAFCRLGSNVTIVQTDPMFLNNVERDGAQILSDALAQDGVAIHLNAEVVNITLRDGQKIVDIQSADNKTTIGVTDILVGVGQRPNTDNLNLKQARITTNASGSIRVNSFFATTNAAVYAVGTVCEGQEFTYIPVTMAKSAVENALFRRRHVVNPALIPWCIYTDPEVAHIGLQVREARLRKIPVKTFTVLMHQVDRAIADSEDSGFIKIHVKEGTDKILGATIVSRHAGDIINGISLAMSNGIGLRDFARMNYPYPTQGDAIKMAATACVATLRPSLVERLRSRLGM